MNDEMKQQVRDRVEGFKKRMGLGDWMIDIKFEEGDLPEDDTCEAQIVADQKYHDASLTIWKCFWDRDSYRQGASLVHELVHIILWQLHPYLVPAGDDAVEEVCQRLAMVILQNWVEVD